MTYARGMAVALALCALAAAGCGLGEGESRGEVELTITRDYGSELISRGTAEASESDTVLRLLDRQAELETRYGGGFVQSIDGLPGAIRDGRRLDWFFYVNGIESPVGSAAYEPAEGDRVWWDYRDWTEAMRVPAVVGSYPEPFLHGFEGERWETEVRCEADATTCERVAEALGNEGIAATSIDGVGEGDEGAIRVLVGPWRRIRPDPVASLLAGQPERSGVFGRFRGGRLQLLDERGEVRSSAREAGLIAALRPGDGAPTWLITGTDPAAVRRLAAPMLGTDLRDRYALAALPGERLRGLPLAAGESG